MAGRASGLLLPVPYFHVVFTLPAPIADIAYQNKAVIYDLLFKVAAQTMLTIAADPGGKQMRDRLGARDGVEKADHRHRRLLRARSERPCCRAGDHQYEFTPSHCDPPRSGQGGDVCRDPAGLVLGEQLGR
jgi:hypothetical protein